MEEKGLKLNDGSYKIFFNATGHKGEISEELRDLLAYFQDPEHAERSTDLIRDLDLIVDKANHDADWRREHMMYELLELDAMKRGQAIGEAKGVAIGVAIGEAKGEAKGKHLMGKLMTILFQQGKLEEANRAASDDAYCEQMLKEYNLV